MTATGIGLVRTPALPVRRESLLERLSTPGAWAVGLVASALFGAALTQSPGLATLHMGVVLIGVVVLGLFGSRPAPLLALTAYAGVCDVLWRATSGAGPYEAGKYAIIFGAGCLAVRFVRRPRYRGGLTAVVLLLVPGAIVTMAKVGPGAARGILAGNLAGLVALVVAVAACSSLVLTASEIRGVYLAVLSPIVSLTATATIGTIEAGQLVWTNEVNFDTSAGFGPNQVSSVIGLGALLCAIVILQPRTPFRLRVVAAATGVWLVGQMVLTFSRGGVFGLVLALAAMGLTSLLTSGQRTRTIVAAAVLIVLGFQIMSWAGAFTDGASETRFTSTNATNRTDIARADLELFGRHPLLGVGPGMAKFERDHTETAAHTEATRLLGEHGLAGLGIVAILGWVSVSLIRSGWGWSRMATVGLLVMALGQTTHSATRIGSVAVGFGLAALRVERE